MSRSRRDFIKLSAATATAAGVGGLLPALSAWTGPPAAVVSEAEAGFLAAAAAGDLAKVDHWIGVDAGLLRATDLQGRTAFALAHLGGHRDLGSFLQAKGYLADVHEAALALDWERFDSLTTDDVSAVNQDHPIGGTAMVAGALGGAGADIWHVYAANGNPSLATRGASPLQAALRYRDLATAEMTAANLLGNDADPNPPDSTLTANSDAPPLHIAAERGSTEMVEMLIRRGADPRARFGPSPKSERTALEHAERAGENETAALLARHAEIPRTHSSSRTAYDANGQPYSPPPIDSLPRADRHRFVGQSHRNFEFVQQALRSEPRLAHSVTTNSEICVEACAHTGQNPIVDLLLEHGAPYSLPTAVMRNDVARAKQLLDEDPLRIHERGAHDFALLWYPIIGQCGLEMLELLVERGAEVEQQHFLGTTALHWACMRGPVEVVEFLIDHGADVTRRGRKFDAAGQTPLQTAESRDQPEIARLLRQRGAKT